MVEHGPTRCLGLEIYCLAVMQIKDMKARRIGGLPGCPRMFFLFDALDRNSTAQMR